MLNENVIPNGVLGVNEIEVVHGEPFFRVLVVRDRDRVLPAARVVGFDQVKVVHRKAFLQQLKKKKFDSKNVSNGDCTRSNSTTNLKPKFGRS